MTNFVLAGMQFGDEGKGSCVDFLANEQDVKCIVRFNGGSQASHTVVTSESILHKFSQLGSGMFYKDAETYITENVVVNLENLLCEAECFAEETNTPLESILKRVYIHENCYMVTPYHVLMNMLRELSQGKNRRGTVGTGVSEVRKFLEESLNENLNGEWLGIQVKDIIRKDSLSVLKRKFRLLYRHVKKFYESNSQVIWKNTPESIVQNLHRRITFLLKNQKAYENVANICHNYFSVREGKVLLNNITVFKSNTIFKDKHDKIIYEGAQGLLLDAIYGTRPNTTFLDTTANFAYGLTSEDEETKSVGVAKAFCSRHGLGAFPTEDKALKKYISDANQSESFWNGKIRFGWFDAVLMRYAQKVNQVNFLYLSAMDQISKFKVLKVCYAYEYIGEIDLEFEQVFNYCFDENGIVMIYDIKGPSEKLGKYLEKCVPQYEYISGWCEDISNMKTKADLPDACMEYIRKIEKLTNIPVAVISVGPTREDKIRLRTLK